MPQESKFIESVKIPVALLVICWVVLIAEYIFTFNLFQYGVLPRNVSGLKGILFSPLIHGDFDHLISNSIPLLVLSWAIFYFYRNASLKVFLILYFVPGILLWVFGRSSYHIGASGLIYAEAAFIFFSGIFRWDVRAIALALVVTFLYGGLIWGVLPIKQGVSWEGHLFGAVTGAVIAFAFRKSDPHKRYDWEDEEYDDDDDPDRFKISHKKPPPF